MVGSVVGSLNLGWPVVDQTTMTTPGVSHPSPTTVEDFRRVLDEGVALDDVGAAPPSLAVLPFVRPDLIKLDMRLLQGRTTGATGCACPPARPWPSGWACRR